MKLAFISGPYRADTPRGIVENIRKAESVALELWRMGYAVICPHKNTSLFDGFCDDSVWLDGDIEILKRCDLIVMISSWETSKGSLLEREKALGWGLPVYYWKQDKDRIEMEARQAKLF